MKIARDKLEGKEIDFLNHITTMWPTEPEDKALLGAVQEAFTVGGKMNSYFSVTPTLVSSLASCAWLVLDHDNSLNQGDYEHVLIRILRGLINTVDRAYEQNSLDIIEGKLYLGSLRLPDWFAEWAGQRY